MGEGTEPLSGDLLKDEEKSVDDPTTPDKVKKVTFDDILAELGEFGLEQKINYFLFSIPYILTSMQLMGWVFVGASFPHRCRVPGRVTKDRKLFFDPFVWKFGSFCCEMQKIIIC